MCVSIRSPLWEFQEQPAENTRWLRGVQHRGEHPLLFTQPLKFLHFHATQDGSIVPCADHSFNQIQHDFYCYAPACLIFVEQYQNNI